MAAWLELSGKRIPCSESCTIGRLPENTVVLDDVMVSRRHALIHAHGPIGFWLVDFGSSNGVLLNKRRIFEPVRLQDRDRIEIASFSLLFRQPHEPDGQRPSPAAAAWKTTQRAGDTFAPMGHGAILFEKDGRISTITPQARAWLGTYFNFSSGSAVLPQKIRVWVERELAAQRNAREGSAPIAPMFIPKENKRLVLQLAERDQDQRLLLLSEEQQVFSAELLQTLGLTPRESEVLHWLAEGKTNPEIGVILSMSARTVGKHLEHIFAKLGVESRTAALLYVVEKLSRSTF